MIKLTEEELEARGVSAMGARKKLLRVSWTENRVCITVDQSHL